MIKRHHDYDFQKLLKNGSHNEILVYFKKIWQKRNILFYRARIQTLIIVLKAKKEAWGLGSLKKLKG